MGRPRSLSYKHLRTLSSVDVPSGEEEGRPTRAEMDDGEQQEKVRSAIPGVVASVSITFLLGKQTRS